ncbi:hypothetical protein HHK36_019439 [Tetracentron sinense]|uniref:Retrotransposon gag domain-containing protein n=1 Tax=Tetracentron sinense TaxID=13715 RepID=A0A835D957_TETSI|nr:hypothetical protein HHK36_019439 [Tetracentron sinense]
MSTRKKKDKTSSKLESMEERVAILEGSMLSIQSILAAMQQILENQGRRQERDREQTQQLIECLSIQIQFVHHSPVYLVGSINGKSSVGNHDVDQGLTQAQDRIEGRVQTSCTHLHSTWKDMTSTMLNRFGHVDFEILDGLLTKMKQGASTVSGYQEEFEKLANRVEGWSDCTLMGTFMQGLRDEIGQKVLMFRPFTLQEAMGLVRRQEEKLQKLHRQSQFATPNSISAVGSATSTIATPLPRANTNNVLAPI